MQAEKCGCHLQVDNKSEAQKLPDMPPESRQC